MPENNPKSSRTHLLARPLVYMCAAAVLYLVIFAAYGCSGSSHPTPTPPLITTQPSSQTVVVGQSATFSVTAAGTAPLAYQWLKGGANISGATSASYTTPPAAAADSGSTFQVVVTNSVGDVASHPATLTVTTASASTVNVLTYHNDNGRTGQNQSETILTPQNVTSAKFGKVGFLPVTGKVDAEPLYVSALAIGGAVHNVVFVATEHGLVYAFDADTLAPLWQTQQLLSAGESTSDDRGCSQITPEIGITSTPVIDPSDGPHGTIFVVAMSKDSGGNYHQRLHALDLTTGAEQSGSPVEISATYLNEASTITFDPANYAERSGLLLLNGTIYMGWTSHCDQGTYTGWIMGYSESTLKQTSVINLTPSGSEGSVWMAGAGLAADSSGNIYFLDANGTFGNGAANPPLTPGGMPATPNYGNSFLKVSTAGGPLAVADYFAMHDTATESQNDADLGSGGALLLPDLQDGSGNTHHLAVGAGKDARLYVVNRDSMGKFNATSDAAIYQEITGSLSGSVFSMPAYFNNTVYYAAVGDRLKAFSIANAKLVAPPGSTSTATFAFPGATPSISSNGSSDGIVWAVENSNGSDGGGPGVLHAYDATNLGSELYNSNQAGSRDQFTDNKFITPMIANGKVYVGTPTGVTVFGLLP